MPRQQLNGAGKLPTKIRLTQIGSGSIELEPLHCQCTSLILLASPAKMEAYVNTFLRFCRTIHSWLGAIVMPWVLIIGATGLYLNHERFVLNLIDSPGLAADDLANLPQVPLTKGNGRSNRCANLARPTSRESRSTELSGKKCLCVQEKIWPYNITFNDN